MFKVSIRTRGWAPLFRSIEKRKSIVSDLRPIWRQLHEDMLAHIRRNFETQGTFGGARWANHDSEPKYRAFKGAIVLHEIPLRWALSGPKHTRLMPSLTIASHPDHIVQAGASRLTIATKVPYAKRLQTGGVGPFGERFPGRNPMQIKRQQWRQHIRDIEKIMLTMATGK